MASGRVLVTGATGFVGSRLIERLVLGTSFQVRAMVRHFSGPGLARLARLPVDLVMADLLDPDAVSEVAKDCDLIVHLAYGNSGHPKQRRQVTVEGTRNILEAAQKHNIGKVVYLSSAAVHGRNPTAQLVDESTPYGQDSDVYCQSKIQAEELVWQYHREHQLPVVVFRPTLVYGPNGRTWTVRLVNEIKSGATLVNGGSGAANLIYVDNLIDAILLSLESAAGDGEAFIMVDDEHLTWKRVYELYAGMIERHPPLIAASTTELEKMRRAGEPSMFQQWVLNPLLLVPKLLMCPVRSLEIREHMQYIPLLKWLIGLVPIEIKDRLKSEHVVAETPTASAAMELPSSEMTELYASESRFSNRKVKRVLGHVQRIPFEEAIDLTRAWLEYQRLVP